MMMLSRIGFFSMHLPSPPPGPPPDLQPRPPPGLQPRPRDLSLWWTLL